MLESGGMQGLAQEKQRDLLTIREHLQRAAEEDQARMWAQKAARATGAAKMVDSGPKKMRIIGRVIEIVMKGLRIAVDGRRARKTAAKALSS